MEVTIMSIHIEVYLAAKQMQREGKNSFSPAELQKKVAEMFWDRGTSISSTITDDCNASVPKHFATVYNYFVRIKSDRYRLFQPGDTYDPSREGCLFKPTLKQVSPKYWPLWADQADEAPVQFTSFTEKNFALFEIEQKVYRAGDPNGELFKNGWIEWNQFVQMVVNELGNTFDFQTEQWQNSGNLNNKYFWSRLKDKGRSNYATCISLMLRKNDLVVNLGVESKLLSSGKSIDNKRIFNQWINDLTEPSTPEDLWDDYSISIPSENDSVTLRQFFKETATRNNLLSKIAENEDFYLDFGKTFSKGNVIDLGPDIVKAVAESVRIIYPFYREVIRKSQDSLFLIGASTTLNENIDRYNQMINSKGAFMYWWSYLIREEYQRTLKQNTPFYLYIYGITPQGKRAITHCMTVDDFITSTGNEGIESPYPDLTVEEERNLKRMGDTKAEICKTWLKVTHIKELPKPLGLDQFVHYDTRGFINPQVMVSSFIYARKIPTDNICTRLINCLNTLLEEFGLSCREPGPLEEMINHKRGFSFDLNLNPDVKPGQIGIRQLSGSRYKGSDKLLFHTTLVSEDNTWRTKLEQQAPRTWLKDGKQAESKVRFEDEHFLSTDPDATHLKLADIDLGDFSEESFIKPLQDLLSELDNLDYIVPQIKTGPGLKVDNLWQTRDLDEILTAIADSEYIFPEEMVINIHNCLHALPDKHFLIFTGISGSGKTRLTQIYVNTLYGLPPGARDNKFFALIPVQPQWSDRTGLLGYYNPITGKYYKPLFLKHLLKALDDPENSYFVCLDEMNLAVVEHYFADILSVMESNQRIELHSFETEVDGVPTTLGIPSNFFIIGTVNVDETTNQFSPKVLDRAYTIEFNEVDLDVFLEKYKQSFAEPDHSNLLDKAGSFFIKFNQELSNHNLHFAYRTFKEILSYMLFNETNSNPLSYKTAIDNMVMQKVLPRIRGDERITQSLEKIAGLVEQETKAENCQSCSLKRLREMLDELNDFGTCQFWR